MKKQILYFVAGVFLTISVFTLWAFKKDKVDAGGGYAVVEYISFDGQYQTYYAYPDGKTEKKKNKTKDFAEGYAQVLNEMELSGYSFIQGYSKVDGAVLIFKKK